jgi:hypothetical protein
METREASRQEPKAIESGQRVGDPLGAALEGGDVPEERTAVIAATQRPAAAGALSDACGPPAWKTLPVMDGGGHSRQGRRHRPRPFDGRRAGVLQEAFKGSDAVAESARQSTPENP